jgi:hypothetical protein
MAGRRINMSNVARVGNYVFTTSGNIRFPQDASHHIADSPFLKAMEKKVGSLEAHFDQGYQKFLAGLIPPSSEEG